MNKNETPYSETAFREYIRSYSLADIRLDDSGEKEWLLETDYATGSVVFHELAIIELIITSKKDGENAFYLHFQLGNEEHAKNLFDEMISTLRGMRNKQKIKVLLTCTSGLTTSFFAQELNKAAQNLQLDFEFSAVSYSNLYENGFRYDVILVAPQIQYEFKKINEIYSRKIVLKIPAAVFGGYKTGEVITMVMKALDERSHADTETEAIRSAFDNDYRILCVGMINHFDTIRIGYCIYDHGKRTLDKEVIKDTHQWSDIEDLLDYALVRHTNIDAIAIAYPGIIGRGRIHHPDYDLHEDFNMGNYLEKKYGHTVILINDVNAIALGYHALYENTDNMVFVFQPRGNYLSGAGIITDGRLLRGWKSSAGEIGRLVPAMVEEPEKKIFDPAGALEIVSKQLLAFIATQAPEKIVLYSELTPDTEEIREYLRQYIEDNYIPEIIWTDRLKTFILPGAMIHALDVLKRLEIDPDYYRHLEQNHA